MRAPSLSRTRSRATRRSLSSSKSRAPRSVPIATSTTDPLPPRCSLDYNTFGMPAVPGIFAGTGLGALRLQQQRRRRVAILEEISAKVKRNKAGSGQGAVDAARGDKSEGGAAPPPAAPPGDASAYLAVNELSADVLAMSISPQPVTLSAWFESGATTSAASSSSSAGASGAGERRRCAYPGCPNCAASMCGACKSVGYCSRACQKRHWAAHKAACKVTSAGSKT
jgi:hypothetical protein